ncbi:hypothetical protein TNCV_1200631 [Trichonephila clavipes]|nr:hypothetical protein TNCV_1200631 [Trichonephila clavipes]
MKQFRIIVNGLQPPQIIDLHTDTEQRIGELLTKVLPDHHSLDILRVRAFARSEPKDVSSCDESIRNFITNLLSRHF